MRYLWLLAPAILGAIAVAQPAARPCCDLWIFEAAQGPDSYAVRLKRSGQTFVVLPAAGGSQLLEGAAARETLDRWIAIGRLAKSTTILLDGRESRFSLDTAGLDVDVVDPPDAADNAEANTLVYIRNASPAQTQAFIREVPKLNDAARARVAAAVETK